MGATITAAARTQAQALGFGVPAASIGSASRTVPALPPAAAGTCDLFPHELSGAYSSVKYAEGGNSRPVSKKAADGLEIRTQISLAHHEPVDRKQQIAVASNDRVQYFYSNS